MNSILAFLEEHPKSSSKEVFEALPDIGGYATVKRELARAVAEGAVIVTGQRKGSKYAVSPTFNLFRSVDLDTYFDKEIDERKIKEGYNFDLIDILALVSIFTEQERTDLES